MERPFPAYQGNDSYIFVCYSHTDAETVYSELVWLKEQACNIWYDEGITPGEEWTQELADAIGGADNFLFFVTPDSVNSRYCRDELHFALNHDKPLVLVYLKETQLTGGLELSLGLTQAILKYELSQKDYSEKLRAVLQLDQQIPVADTITRRGSKSDLVAKESDVSEPRLRRADKNDGNELFLYGRSLYLVGTVRRLNST